MLTNQTSIFTPHINYDMTSMIILPRPILMCPVLCAFCLSMKWHISQFDRCTYSSDICLIKVHQWNRHNRYQTTFGLNHPQQHQDKFHGLANTWCGREMQHIQYNVCSSHFYSELKLASQISSYKYCTKFALHITYTILNMEHMRNKSSSIYIWYIITLTILTLVQVYSTIQL